MFDRPTTKLERMMAALLLTAALLSLAGCQHKKDANPLSHINSKQPDKVLFDRSMDAMKARNYESARLTLQTLINTYPDSEYVARAKLTLGEAWYQEGSSAALEQAETEFRDFITFFPNMPEAAEAQKKLGDIHYRQMEKPDRDFTHAKRAQEEYRQVLLQYPDSKLVPETRQRLLEVQEVLAEREYRIAHLYFARGALLAAIARAKTLVDTYPLYSKADEAYFILGQCYEQEVTRTRAVNGKSDVKQKLIQYYEDHAAEAYTTILTRYPAMPRVKDAKLRLAALKRPVPQPTPEALAQNKREINSRVRMSRYDQFLSDMSRQPDVSTATRVGEPTLEDPKETDAPALTRAIAAMTTTASPETAVTTKTAAAPADTKKDASDIPAQAPEQMNESSSENASAVASSSSAPNTQDDTKNASSSQKKKRKHRLGIPLPF